MTYFTVIIFAILSERSQPRMGPGSRALRTLSRLPCPACRWPISAQASLPFWTRAQSEEINNNKNIPSSFCCTKSHQNKFARRFCCLPSRGATRRHFCRSARVNRARHVYLVGFRRFKTPSRIHLHAVAQVGVAVTQAAAAHDHLVQRLEVVLLELVEQQIVAKRVQLGEVYAQIGDLEQLLYLARVRILQRTSTTIATKRVHIEFISKSLIS